MSMFIIAVCSFLCGVVATVMWGSNLEKDASSELSSVESDFEKKPKVSEAAPSASVAPSAPSSSEPPVSPSAPSSNPPAAS